jgi:putative nucleotidyltransferase with HDIG domain
MPVKRVPVDDLKVGMYVAGFDRSWLTTSFLTHTFLIKTAAQIEKLRQSGIKEVDVDPSRSVTNQEPEEEPFDPQAPIEVYPLKAATGNVLPGSLSPEALGAELAQARQARTELLQHVETIFQNIGTSEIIHSQEVKHVVTDMMPKVMDSQAAFMALIRTREFDPALRDHVLSVSTLAMVMGHTLGYDEKRLRTLASGALLHDVGMLRLPNYMLRLSKTLSKPERELYETHPRLGVTLLQKNGGFHTDVLRVVAEHHASQDQSGYPPDVAGGQTGEMSQIILIADRYDEMITGQLGVAPVPAREVLSTLYREAQAGKYNLTLVSHLIRVVGVYPLYSLVQLNTGDRGIVVSVTPGKLHLPVILLIRDAAGNPYNPAIPLDLSAQSGPGEPKSIATVLDADREGIKVEHYLQGRGASA